MVRPVLDIDNPASWPGPVIEWARRWAERRDSLDEMRVDLMEAESELRALLVDRKARAYHCTRLLDHEVASVRESGLLALTSELVADRLQQALRVGALKNMLS